MPIDQADLFCREGSSDKEYHLTLEEVPGGYVVEDKSSSTGRQAAR